MITNLIVIASLVLTGAFVLAWLLSPALRARIEQPKHQFQDTLRQYESTRLGTGPHRRFAGSGAHSWGPVSAEPSETTSDD